MNGCGSACGSSTISRSIELARSSSTSSSCSPSSTISRRAAVQRWPARQEGRLDDDHRRGVEVLGVPHDERIVAAQLEREDLVRRVGELRWSAMPARAEPVNSRPSMPGCAASARPSLGPADQQPDDAFGDAGLVEAFDQELAGRGRLLRRLEDHRIAGDQRRDDVAVGQVRGEIVRARAPPARRAACGGPRPWSPSAAFELAAAGSARHRRRPKSRPC